MRKEFQFLSKDGITRIHAAEWIPADNIKGVLQICHGMVEYIERYDEFAEFLSKRGYYVVGHDHLGHGQSIQSEEFYGFFSEHSGNEYVIGDIHQLREIVQKKYPGIPYFMLGHSMGSFLLRQYLADYSGGLCGAIIMGTGYKGAFILNAGMLLCRLFAAGKGWKYRSSFINNLGLGGYNKKFEPGESTKDWVTSDRVKRGEYLSDPLCSFVFTVGGYYQLFLGMKSLTRMENIAQIDKLLPVIFVSGEEDPVGDFGRGVRKVFEQFRQAGIRDTTILLYEGDRHEILNETDRQQVYEDLLNWINGVNK